jgi:ABC-type nitrate/sulfonate/bicarbonate transport system permease component
VYAKKARTSKLFRGDQGVKGSDGGLLDTAIPKVVIIVLPASLPYIFTGVRLAWSISLIVIIAAEMIGATAGMGHMVLEAQQTFRTERVFAGIFAIRAIGFATDLGFRRLRRWLLPWY